MHDREHHPHDHHAHGHDEARELVENAFVFSKKEELRLERAMPLAALERALDSALRGAARQFGVEGVILGHMKALLRSGGEWAAYSITRLDSADKTYSPGWRPEEYVEQIELTVNIISAVQPNELDETALQTIFAGLETVT